MLPNKLNNTKILTVLIIIIFIILGGIILFKLDLKRENATLTYDNTEATFIVPRGYKFNEKDSLNNLLRYTNKKNEDVIIYAIEQMNEKRYEQIKQDIKTETKNIYGNIKTKEYKIKIDDKNTKVIEIEYKPNHKNKNKTTYAFYPLTNNYVAKITITSVNVNKANLKNYIKIK